MLIFWSHQKLALIKTIPWRSLCHFTCCKGKSRLLYQTLLWIVSTMPLIIIIIIYVMIIMVKQLLFQHYPAPKIILTPLRHETLLPRHSQSRDDHDDDCDAGDDDLNHD